MFVNLFFFFSLMYVLIFYIIILILCCIICKFCRKPQVMGKKRKGSGEQSEFHAKKPKKEFENEYECESCQQIIYGGSACVSEHLQGSWHKRLMHVYYLSDYFK